VTRPRLLDLFCCEGGAGVGYQRAGFDVTGVDLNPQPRYPFPFIQADAIQYVTDHGHEYDAIHASPPCQLYSITKHSHSAEHPDLVGPTRDALQSTGLPWIIENVVGAPLVNPLILCGTEFDLTAVDTDGTPLYLRRHRLFESNRYLFGAGGCRCAAYKHRGWTCAGAYGGGSSDRAHAKFVRRGGYTPGKQVRAALLGGLDWMTLHGLSQSIPPAYTAFLGAQMLTYLEAVA
jgi:DNA (cytosine-5)-methyltransferase 1